MEILKTGKTWLIVSMATKATGAVLIAGAVAGVLLGDGGTFSISWQPGA